MMIAAASGGIRPRIEPVAPHGIVFATSTDALLAGRTERSFAAAGIAPWGAVTDVEALAAQLRSRSTSVVIARAGAWLVRRQLLPSLAPSATGRPLVALGAIRPLDGTSHAPDAAAWQRVLAKCGGDLDQLSRFSPRLPRVACCYFEAATAVALAELIDRGFGFDTAVALLVRQAAVRAVHLPALDAHEDRSLRLLQLVTSIQIGGAERVTLDLADELSRQGLSVCVAAFGRPARRAFPEPANFADLSHIANQPEARAAAVAELCREFGADLVHAHLIRGTEAAAIKRQGLPLVMTVHNMPQAWPAGLSALDSKDADLLLACAQAVERQVHASAPGVPVRTLWNGIDPRPLLPSAEMLGVGAALRVAWGWSPTDFVIAAVANPRPQKRLHLLPEIVAVLAARTVQNVRLLLVGAPAEGSREAAEAITELEDEIARWGISDRVHWTGAVVEVARIFAAADVLLSTSAFEGLSLVHLEALAAGVPVVATDAGGTAEIAQRSGTMQLLPTDAAAEAFVNALQAIVISPPPRVSRLPPDFTRYRMAARARLLYPQALERARRSRRREGLWLITNNFSIGGAQSSARRLLVGLAQRGVKVRATVVEEQPHFPTPGREALLRAGIAVGAIPPPKRGDAADAVARILHDMVADPPQAVVFWNLITSYKVLLADCLLDAAVFDVSPGEMYFDSLAKYFANPRPALPYATAREYGSRLAGVVVKYAAEAASAAALLGGPVHVIRNGVPLPALGKRRAPGKLLIGTAARISPDKRLDDLLAALRLAHSRLPQYELRIAGGVDRHAGAYARDLRKLARGLPVLWCGELSDTTPFLAELDIFAMISEPAGCPNASLEAMAAGLPIVATDVGGVGEQVIDGITGALVPRRDPAAFADALVQLAGDAAARRRLGTAGRERIAAEFSLERMLDQYAALLLPSAASSPATSPEMAEQFRSTACSRLHSCAADPS